MTDQAQRLEIATVRAEIGSNITYRFNNDAIDALLIPTDSGNIKNLKQVIADIQQEGAEKISFATKIYPTTAAGISATVNGEIFLVASADVDEIYAVWQNNSGSAVDTGKRAISASAVIAATDAAQASANDAQTAASEATAKVAPFLSPASIDPAARRDGSALQPGDTYFNTIIQAIKVYSTSGWVAANVTGTDLSAAINTREPTIYTGSSGQFWAGDKTFKNINKSDVGLSNVDNTSDVNKPISIAQKNEIDSKASLINVGFIVSSISDLKSIDSSKVKSSFVLGYYVKGDGGGGAYYFDSTDTASLDNGGTVIVAVDGGRWKLSQQGRVSVKQFGAKGDGATDDSGAITRAHTAIPALYYPASTYRCASKITLSGQVLMLGDAPGASKLLFNGSTQGVDITQQSSDQTFEISRLSFITTDTTNSFTGLRINGIPQLTSNTDGLRLFLGDRNKYRGKVYDLIFSGSSNSAGWKVGLNMECMMNYEVHNVTYTGLVPAAVGNLTGCAILINGDGGGTDIRIHGIWAYYCLYGVLMPDYVEGVHLYDYEMVVVTYGIVARYASAFSKLPSASSGLLSIYLDQGHVNCLQAGVLLEKSNGNFIERQNIYLQPRAADGIAYGIYINGGNDHRVRDIFVSGDNALNTKSSNYSVLIQGVGLSFVDGVTASSLQSAVTLSASSYNEIMNLQARACVNVCGGDSGSTQNSIGPGRSSSITGAKYQVALDNNIRMDEYATFVSRTLAAGASATISISLPAGTFTEAPRFATISIDSSSIYYRWQYLRSSSSSSQVTFLLAAASPASSIPAETIEVSVNAKGI